MSNADLSRRRFLEMAAALSAAAVFSGSEVGLSAAAWRERRDLYPEAVASGDPISADSDWTCRVLVGGLKSGTVYSYRFTDEARNGSRIGRTINVDLQKAPAVSNPALAPHLSFVDMGGHGYATVHVTSEIFETDFVCTPRPIERSDRPDDGPLRYRVRHRARTWKKGERPRLEQQVLEGNTGLSA